ncbi:MAG: PEP-CTERM sorting domain-containing protein [Proteobacteria bacterium]|uniref:PEP-CTERM sorting domain-containing protein n=1 Tax=Aquabacterium sp. TaxID=1872578 RepID=UPI0035C6ED7C|nr:PEP-CTERM sorting domain-containing protein [Pseudomonadota bacterium]
MKFHKLSALLLALGTAGAAQAALTAGDIAIIGRINNGAIDSFAFVALSNISAGEVVYFTDNGWTGTAFRGSSATDGDGNENLTKWTAASNVAAGTIVLSTNASFTTDGVTGGITGATAGSYAPLALSTAGDQITAFQNSNPSNPLFNTATQTALYTLDDTNGFEVATSASTGGVVPGLTAGSTAVTLNYPVGGTIAINASVLAGPAKSKAEWLSAFANASNWSPTSAGLPTGSIAMTAVPEPSSHAIALAGLAVAGLVARRRKAA